MNITDRAPITVTRFIHGLGKNYLEKKETVNDDPFGLTSLSRHPHRNPPHRRFLAITFTIVLVFAFDHEELSRSCYHRHRFLASEKSALVARDYPASRSRVSFKNHRDFSSTDLERSMNYLVVADYRTARR